MAGQLVVAWPRGRPAGEVDREALGRLAGLAGLAIRHRRLAMTLMARTGGGQPPGGGSRPGRRPAPAHRRCRKGRDPHGRWRWADHLGEPRGGGAVRPSGQRALRTARRRRPARLAAGCGRDRAGAGRRGARGRAPGRLALPRRAVREHRDVRRRSRLRRHRARRDGTAGDRPNEGRVRGHCLARAPHAADRTPRPRRAGARRRRRAGDRAPATVSSGGHPERGPAGRADQRPPRRCQDRGRTRPAPQGAGRSRRRSSARYQAPSGSRPPVTGSPSGRNWPNCRRSWATAIASSRCSATSSRTRSSTRGLARWA